MTENLFKAYQNQRWSFVEYNHEELNQVQSRFQLNSTLAKVLIHNAKTADLKKIEALLEPNPEILSEYAGFCDKSQLDKAFSRVKQAQKNNESIVINGDPDADGISGTAILVAGLRQLGIKTQYAFPIRPVEGHGLQVRIINEAKEQGASLVITTDCGTKDNQSVAYANEQGIDVIITDHHILGSELPDAVAIVNPCTVKEKTVFKDIAGSTVSFVFIKALYAYMNQPLPDFLNEFGLMVSALGSLSDRVSLLNPFNRLIVKKGVEAFFESEREGMKALRDISMGSDGLNMPRHLSRTVIPRLNAPGRIGNPKENIPDSSIVVDLLLLGKGKRNKAKATHVSRILDSLFAKAADKKSEKTGQDRDRSDAMMAASDVDTINEQRKRLTAQIEDEMDSLIETQVNPDKDRVIILEGRDWNSGVIGIDADRLKERFLRPAIILNKRSDSAYIRGSARSIPRIDIYSAIDAVEIRFKKEHSRKLFLAEVETAEGTQIVSAFGGHSQACGFTLHENDVPLFKEYLRAEMETLSKDQFEYHYDVVDQLSFDQITPSLIEELDAFSPFGQRFEFPTFFMKDCSIKGGTVFGNRYQKSLKQHVNFKVSGSGKVNKSRSIEAVGFGLWEKYCYVKENIGRDTKVDIIFMLERDPRKISKRSKRSGSQIRLNVLDIRSSS